MISIKKQILNNFTSFGAMRRRGASFFYNGIVTVKIFCGKYPKLASLSILIIIYSVAYVAYGEELAMVVGEFIQSPFTSIGKYVIITTQEKVLVQTLQKAGISNSTQFNHLLNEKENLTQKLTAAEKAVEKTAELAQSAHDSNTEFKKILGFVGGAVVLASIFYFLGGASLGNANVNLELPPKTAEVAATLSNGEQIAYAANFEKIGEMGEGLFGEFEIKKAVNTSNEDIYKSEYVSEAQKLMAKLLKEDSSWREAIANLNKSIAEIVKKSKDLRIHQSSEVSGITHYYNFLALVLTSASLDSAGSPSSGRHGKSFVPAIIEGLQSFQK